MSREILRSFSLAASLFLFWLALSGHLTPLLLAMGIGSALVCLAVALRLRTVDLEGHPAELTLRAFLYLPWLAGEILKSAWAVTKIILHPKLPISPALTAVRASQRTSLGRAIYANSITLTPGTITVGVEGSTLTVHALQREGAIDLEGGAMDRRVGQFEAAA